LQSQEADMTIIFQGGPCDGYLHTLPAELSATLPKSHRVLRHQGKGPEARYKWRGKLDADGRHIFEHWPPQAGEPVIAESRQP